MSKLTLTIKEAANEFCLPQYTIRQWLLSGQLPHVKAGKRYLLTRTNIERFLNGEFLQPVQQQIARIRPVSEKIYYR
jgi:excisionase family DNA binding protein